MFSFEGTQLARTYRLKDAGEYGSISDPGMSESDMPAETRFRPMLLENCTEDKKVNLSKERINEHIRIRQGEAKLH